MRVHFHKHSDGYVTTDGRWLVIQVGFVRKTTRWKVVDTLGRLPGGEVVGRDTARDLIDEQERAERRRRPAVGAGGNTGAPRETPAPGRHKAADRVNPPGVLRPPTQPPASGRTA